MTIHPDGPMAAQLVAPMGTEPAAPMVTSFDNGTMRDGQSPCDGMQLLSVPTDRATMFGAPDVGVVSRAPDARLVSRAPDVGVVTRDPDVGAVSRAPDMGADSSADSRAPDVGADSRAPDMGSVFRVSQTNYEETSEFCSIVRDGKFECIYFPFLKLF
jgi:hypothetical protein